MTKKNVHKIKNTEGPEVKTLAEMLRSLNVSRETFLGIILLTRSEKNAREMCEWLKANPKKSQRRMIQAAMYFNSGRRKHKEEQEPPITNVTIDSLKYEIDCADWKCIRGQLLEYMIDSEDCNEVASCQTYDMVPDKLKSLVNMAIKEYYRDL